MKIRHPWLIRSLGWAGAWMVRGWLGSLRYRIESLADVEVRPDYVARHQRYIYAFWHENILVPAYLYAQPDIHVLISEHADGQLIAAVCRHLGLRIVSGSTTRGSIKAVKQMIQLGRDGHLAITPDGPRGPRRHLQPGLVYLAARTQMHVVPLGFGMDQPWRMGSWDRFAIPRPLSRATCVLGVPIHVPRRLDPEIFEHYRQRIEAALGRVSAMAEDWAATGRRPTPLAGLPVARSSDQRNVA